MFPLHDDNPTILTPVITIGLIALCAVVFLWQVSLGPSAGDVAVLRYGLIPALLFGEARPAPDLAALSAELTVVTSMFLHGGWMHLIGNMLYLWIFGNNVEDSMGHGRFALFYLICGTVAALAHAAQDTGSTIPVIGASGAVSGVLGAYVLLYPRARVLVLVWLGIFVTTMRIPAGVVLAFWFLLQFFSAAVSGSSGGGVAWWAHIGGFLAGMALIPFFRNPDIPLFGGRRRRGPWG